MLGRTKLALAKSSTPSAILLLGPAALALERLPPVLASAVRDAQSADAYKPAALVAQCSAAAAEDAAAAEVAAEGGDSAGELGGMTPEPGSRNSGAAVCGRTLLTASAVEELSALASGVARLVSDAWGGCGVNGAPCLGFVDMHRLTKGHEALAVAAADTAAGAILGPAGTTPGPGAVAGPNSAAQSYPALAAPILLEALAKAATQLAIPPPTITTVH
ncbi:hypothetical protein HYH03_014650 [Edaphochlamys debaryana]|uniref:Uncharacterized protein n=1 Tax=Edaphochlamys debaryana TaxID=47281 RepID=A0A835XMC4_9CHLO|nr:hypothetical protein HYH03_014650 [Edaphochlamys debaryana]|eukprot:KAG2486723.1 hypothetical protein HYH03_014650 [Edaphochlamys debaryana]